MPYKITDLDTVDVPDFYFEPMTTGFEVTDQLFGGEGLIKSQVITFDAPRGSGKTTLFLQILDKMSEASPTTKTVYISQEEPEFQLAFKKRKLGLMRKLQVIGDEHEVDLDDLCELTETHDLIIVDSYSCVDDGTEEQLTEKERIRILKRAAKANVCTIVLILHQTKDGKSKGDSSIEHMGDTCMSIARVDIEEYGENVRKLYTTKNRFGCEGEALIKLTNNGFDLDSPIVSDVNNDENVAANNRVKNTAQALKPRENLAILEECIRLETEDYKMKLDSLATLVEDFEWADDKTFKRCHRHLDHMEQEGYLLKVGRGKKAHWEITDKGRERLITLQGVVK